MNHEKVIIFNAIKYAMIGLTLMAGTAQAQLTTQNLEQGLTPTDLVDSLVVPGVTVSNITYTGANRAAGLFAGGSDIINIADGVILSSGRIGKVIGPNVSDGTSTTNGTAGDPDLDILSGIGTLDAAVLEFDFVTNSSQIFIQYVFASDEYNEYADSTYNDSFGFFINGTNCALVNGQPVSVNSINNGNPFGSLPNSNPEFYINNDPNDPESTIDTEMDGFTTVLLCAADVNPGVTNHAKLAIADAGDDEFDSNVFIITKGFTTTDPTVVPVPALNLAGLLGLIVTLLGIGLISTRRFTRS